MEEHWRNTKTSELLQDKFLWGNSVAYGSVVHVDSTCMGAQIVLTNLRDNHNNSLKGFVLDDTLHGVEENSFFVWDINVIERVARSLDAKAFCDLEPHSGRQCFKNVSTQRDTRNTSL